MILFFYYVIFMKYLWMSKISLVWILLKSTEKACTYSFNYDFFFMLSIVKSCEILLKHNGNGFLPESFVLNWYIWHH